MGNNQSKKISNSLFLEKKNNRTMYNMHNKIRIKEPCESNIIDHLFALFN